MASYKFRVSDSLVNIGPIADIAVGESFDTASASLLVRFASFELVSDLLPG